MLTRHHRGQPLNRPLLVGSVLLHQHWSLLLLPWLIPRFVPVEPPAYSPLGIVLPPVYKALRLCRSSSAPFALLHSAYRNPFGPHQLLSTSLRTPGGTTRFFLPKLFKLQLPFVKPLQVLLLRVVGKLFPPLLQFLQLPRVLLPLPTKLPSPTPPLEPSPVRRRLLQVVAPWLANLSSLRLKFVLTCLLYERLQLPSPAPRAATSPSWLSQLLSASTPSVVGHSSWLA